MPENIRIALTGFMGVGKSSVARHLAHILKCKKIDLDTFIEENEGRRIAEIIDTDGEESYRNVETRNLRRALDESGARILSLGGGTWTIAANRDLLAVNGFTSDWLEAPFRHRWLKI